MLTRQLAQAYSRPAAGSTELDTPKRVRSCGFQGSMRCVGAQPTLSFKRAFSAASPAPAVSFTVHRRCCAAVAPPIALAKPQAKPKGAQAARGPRMLSPTSRFGSVRTQFLLLGGSTPSFELTLSLLSLVWGLSY